MEAVETILGKVCITPRGEYDAATHYEPLDVIGHNGGSYLALTEFQGTPPIGDGITTMLLSAPGATGLTAYQYAQQAGYTGTEEQFAADLAAVDGLDNKADRGSDGYVIPAQISPLQGLQTGVICNTGGNNGFVRATPVSSKTYGRTLEFLIDKITDDTSCFIFRQSSATLKEGIAIQLSVSGQLFIRFMEYEGRVAGIIPDGAYHIVCVISEKPEDGFATLTSYMNGIRLPALQALADYDLSEVAQYIGHYGSLGLKAPVRLVRIFDRALTGEEIGQLWNAGNPMRHVSDPDLKLELIPQSALLDPSGGVWKDVSGCGNDFTISGSGVPEYDYSPMPNLKAITIDTGIFYTDIVSASKLIPVPFGYAVTDVYVRNFNENELTVSISTNNTDSVIEKNTVVPRENGDNKGAWYNIPVIAYPVMRDKTISSNLAVYASGNTTEGGMQIQVHLKYVGE